jgi:predicted AAA+ superfamily ATPase
MTNTLLEKMAEIEKAGGKDWFKGFQKADSVQDIISLSDKYGINVTEEVAQEAFKLLNEAELSDEQLMNISGGFGGLTMPMPKVEG